MRPAIGARTSLHSRLSSACFSAASAEPTWPAASRWVDLRVSNSRSVRVWFVTSGVARSTSEVAISSLDLRALQIGLGLIDRELVGPRIDHEQQVALLDDLAITEMNGIDESGHPGANVDGRQRLEAAGVFVPFGDLLLQRLRHRDRRRRRRAAGGRLVVAAGEHAGAQCRNDENGRPHHGAIFHAGRAPPASPVHCFLFRLVFQRDVSPPRPPRCRSAANAAPPA